MDAAFQQGKSRNWFGGSSTARPPLRDEMHYRGLLRIARRDGGVRLYAARDDVQRSPVYPSGMTLRHARIVRYRDDKAAAEADTIDAVRAIAVAAGVVES